MDKKRKTFRKTRLFKAQFYIFLIAKNLHDSKNSRIFAAKDRNRRNSYGKQCMQKVAGRHTMLLLRFSKPGSKTGALRGCTANQQTLDNRYLEPFKADKRKVIGLGIELDEEGKGLQDWEITE